eukprot:10591221-Alexandrium_andersonii.AAC.1
MWRRLCSSMCVMGCERAIVWSKRYTSSQATRWARAGFDCMACARASCNHGQAMDGSLSSCGGCISALPARCGL